MTAAPSDRDDPTSEVERARPLRIDPLLVHLAAKLLGALGALAARQREGRLARPLERWRSPDLPVFLDRLRRATDDDYMGLGASRCAPGASAFIIDLTSRCTSLRDAITESFRFSAMVTGALTFRLVERGDRATIEIRRAADSPATADMLVDWHMIVWHKLPQRLIGSVIRLDRVDFDHTLDTRYGIYASMFGAECAFNRDGCALHFARDLLDRRVVLRPQEARLLTIAASERFSHPAGLAIDWTQTLVARLRSDIAAGRRPSTLETLAAEFHVSGQTLRRRLRAEAIGYRALKARARGEAARDALSRAATAQDASFAAGFADPGGLARALRGGGGPSLREIRNEIASWIEPSR